MLVPNPLMRSPVGRLGGASVTNAYLSAHGGLRYARLRALPP
jgi:hypothetical protein